MPFVFLHRPTAESLDSLGPVRRFLRIWLPALIGVAIIVVESQATFSVVNTSSWLRPIWEHLFGPISTPTWEELHHYLRKTGHFIGYGTLCVLFLRAWLLTLARNPALRTTVWRWRSWLLGVASTFVVASGDELHQSFLPSRTGLFSDVILDTCGGMVISSLVLFIAWCLRRAFARS
jgi:VanZ family protein